MQKLIESSSLSYEPRKVQTHVRKGRWVRYSERQFFLFTAPWIIGFLALTLIPLIYALIISFTDFDGISPHWHWIGFANYLEVFQTADTWYSLGRSLLYTALVVPLSVSGGLGLALLLNQRLRAVGFFRTIFYLPSIVPVVASALMWRLIFNYDVGPLNALLYQVGVHAVSWLDDPIVFYALIILTLWGLGGGMVILLAGLQGIPSELLEAAKVDGANAWQTFRVITLPLLSPVIFFQIVTGVIGSLQTFVQVFLLSPTNGSFDLIGTIPRSNDLYMVNVFVQFFANQRFGYGSAMLWLLFVIILTMTLLVLRSSTFWVYYEVDSK